nr:protein kintoun isoform X1 [Onthophagus taurus]
MACGGSFDKLRDMDLTRDEVEKLGDALKNKEFRKLLCDYVDEIRDPENQKLYQNEITQLEKERGYDVTFINPSAGYVIKTSLNGTKKAFINICKNENIEKPSSKRSVQEGQNGLNWNLPFSLAPPREDIDKKGVRCEVFDVVFHPDTLYLAANNKAFLNMVNNTACEAVESNFNVKLDCKNLKFPKMQYKGMAHPAIIRKKSQSKPEPLEPQEQVLMDKLYDTLPKVEEQIPCKFKVKRNEGENASKYTIPNYMIKHRSNIELEEFTEDKNCKINCTIPKELIIEINLPLLKSAGDITLDVTEKTVQLISEKPSKYKLELTLPYCVNQDMGNAKFAQDSKKLVITLPVKRKSIIDAIDDSGVESDHGSSPTEFSSDELITILDDPKELKIKNNNFLDPNIQYIFPEFSSHFSQNILTLTLQTRNVDESSLKKLTTPKSLHLKFSTVSSGFYPVSYSFYIELNSIQEDDLSVEVWDNNVIIQIPINLSKIDSYLVGLNENEVDKKFLNDTPPSTSTQSEENSSEYLKHVQENKSCSKKKFKRTKNVQIEIEKLNEDENKPPMSKAIDIEGAVSESSGDELSSSYSPSKSKGILKRFPGSCSSVSRSVSESSIDDFLWASSFENCHASLDSIIPEDGEVSSSLKKTVRFNDVVLKQLYRFNSSILGQKKKNQRKAKNKKRAHDRRHSESEMSELDELKERDSKTNEPETNNVDKRKAQAVDDEEAEEEEEGNLDIFDLDI